MLSCHSLIDREETSDTAEGNHMLVPTIPAGVSGTALAASLLRDGWSVCYLLLSFPFYVLFKNYFFEGDYVCGFLTATLIANLGGGGAYYLAIILLFISPFLCFLIFFLSSLASQNVCKVPGSC